MSADTRIIEPQKDWRKKRLEELLAAIDGYTAADMTIPDDWMDEVQEHSRWMARYLGRKEVAR